MSPTTKAVVNFAYLPVCAGSPFPGPRAYQKVSGFLMGKLLLTEFCNNRFA